MDINICYLLLFIIIIFLIYNFNCKETFNVGGQSSNRPISKCELYAINVGDNCSNVSASATIIPQNCCEAIIPNASCNWNDTNNNEDIVKVLRNALPSRYNICQQQESQKISCNKDIIKFIDGIYNGTGIDCEIDGETVTKCGPICKSIFTEFYKNCETQINESELVEEFRKVRSVCLST